MAGALVGNPKVLILDEPTVGLDPKQITEIRTLIKNLGKNTYSYFKLTYFIRGKSNENLENKVANNNVVYVTVEDNENKIDSIKEKIEGIKEIKFISENEDKTKKYIIK